MRARSLAAVLAALLAMGQMAEAQAPIPDALLTRVRSALVDALRPALPYPDATDEDTAANGDTAAPWVVRWPAADDPAPVVTVVANTLNRENQARARAADAEIQRAVMAVQQRTQEQYDRAVTEFARSGRVAAPVESVTLDDEGLAGARIDASTRVTIAIEIGEPRHIVEIRSSVPPVVSQDVPGAVLVKVPENVYRDRADADAPETAHLHVAEARLWFGPMAPPLITEPGTGRYVVTVASAPQNTCIRIEGNEAFVDQILQKTDWKRLAALAASIK